MRNQTDASLLNLARDSIELLITRTQVEMAGHLHVPDHLFARLRALSDVRQKIEVIADGDNIVQLSRYMP